MVWPRWRVVAVVTWCGRGGVVIVVVVLVLYGEGDVSCRGRCSVAVWGVVVTCRGRGDMVWLWGGRYCRRRCCVVW